MPSFHEKLSIPSLLLLVRTYFLTLTDTRKKDVTISLSDTLMSALAVFMRKYSSLLKFDQERTTEIIKHNLKTLYGVEKAPCDTYMREVLDPIEPGILRTPFTLIIYELKRNVVLKEYEYIQRF